MAEEQNPVVLPPADQLALLGLTEEDVDGFPEITAFTDVLGYVATDACRKGVVGVGGTNLQMVEFLENNEFIEIAQVLLFLLKNRIKPLADDVVLIATLVVETGRRLGEGDMQAVNRRHALTRNGVVKPRGDDIVGEDLRMMWVGPVAP